jgi:peptide/nickel transport system substrate-binding protein
MDRISRAALLAALLGVTAIAPATAATLRWANDSDVGSMDPYARHETFLMSFDSNIYEPLIRHDRELRLEPSLATEWSQTAPEVWRFKLRRGVRFQDGTPFTADDVVFSFARVTGPGSALAEVVTSVREVRKIDDHTVDVVTKGTDPTLPAELTAWDMMSKNWCENNNATGVAEIAGGEENYAASHANGTGPFTLKERQAEQRTVLIRNPLWWDKPEHNLDQVIFQPIADGEARVAALLAGGLDMIYAVPPQDVDRITKAPHLRILHGPEMRTVFLGFDVTRSQLFDSDIKGRNPFRDIRVRKAFYQAIDEDVIKSKVMRGFAMPTGLMVGPGVNGFDTALNRRLLPYDPEAAKRLLTEAGYPHGFALGMDCPNDRYVNDEGICDAVVAMLAKIGVTVHARIDTRAKYFARILGPNYQTSFYLLGWTPATYDAQDMLFNVVATRDGQGRGDFNVGGYSNPKLDALIDRLENESDEKKREALLHDALAIVKEDVVTIPLHQQVLIWAARDTVNLVQPADDYFPLRYVRMK